MIVGAESLGLTLSEVEGDAVLYYSPGKPNDATALIDQCETMFRAFHQQLKVIERDSICPCGACQSATDLTPKFVVHFGKIKEIAVAGFRKAAGVDMIVAHRLMKNSVPSDECVLISDAYRQAADAADRLPRYDWRNGQDGFAGAGDLGYAYATLDHLRACVPDLPTRARASWSDR